MSAQLQSLKDALVNNVALEEKVYTTTTTLGVEEKESNFDGALNVYVGDECRWKSISGI